MVDVDGGSILALVLAALGRVRLMSTVIEELRIHEAIAAELLRCGLPFVHEADLGSGCRIDFLVAGEIGVEVKKGRPGSVAVRRQLERYGRTGKLSRIVVAAERGVPWVPAEAAGVPVHAVTLSSSWGVAL